MPDCIEDMEILNFTFRVACVEDAMEISDIEQACFPPHEACSECQMIERVKRAPEQFLLAVDEKTGRIAGTLNGLATDEEVFRDAFFDDASLHNPDGSHVILLGLSVLPEYRGKGLARELVERYAKMEREKGRSALVLTCLDEKVAMYERMRFVDKGLSNSTWGGEAWHEMIYIL